MKTIDIEDMGMAHWYLQGRLTQNEDYSVVLDQLWYMVLIALRFCPQHDNTNVTKEDKTKRESPSPTTFIPTTKDCATNSHELQQLEQIYGFQYSSVIGMLIFLLNTATVLQYAIGKLAQFDALPQKKHFKALINLLHHVRTHKHDYGTKFYPPESKPPIYNLV